MNKILSNEDIKNLLPTFVFIDIKNKFTTCITNTLNKEFDLNRKINYRTITGDIYEQNHPNSIYVSPANSLGFMDGGIDAIYSRKMFPECEIRVKNTIKKIGIQDLMGRYYLPIGCSTLVPVKHSKNHDKFTNQYLMSTPTMLLPQNVSQTKNPYYVMYAIVRHCAIFNQYFKSKNYTPINQIFIPGLATGIGQFNSQDCANLICKAMKDAIFDEFSSVSQINKNNSPNHWSYIPNYQHILKEQPLYYQNTEFVEIPIDKIKNIN